MTPEERNGGRGGDGGFTSKHAELWEPEGLCVVGLVCWIRDLGACIMIHWISRISSFKFPLHLGYESSFPKHTP